MVSAVTIHNEILKRHPEYNDYELSFEDGAKLRGKFLIQKLDYAGDFNGERNYAMQLESSGAVVPA